MNWRYPCLAIYKQSAVTLIHQLFILSTENKNLHNTVKVCWGKLDFVSQGSESLIITSHLEGSTMKSLYLKKKIDTVVVILVIIWDCFADGQNSSRGITNKGNRRT